MKRWLGLMALIGITVLAGGTSLSGRVSAAGNKGPACQASCGTCPRPGKPCPNPCSKCTGCTSGHMTGML